MYAESAVVEALLNVCRPDHTLGLERLRPRVLEENESEELIVTPLTEPLPLVPKMTLLRPLMPRVVEVAFVAVTLEKTLVPVKVLLFESNVELAAVIVALPPAATCVPLMVARVPVR